MFLNKTCLIMQNTSDCEHNKKYKDSGKSIFHNSFIQTSVYRYMVSYFPILGTLNKNVNECEGYEPPVTLGQDRGN